MQEKLRNLYLKQDKLPSFLEEDEGGQLIEDSYINLAVIDLKAQQEREAKLLSNPENTEANEIDLPEDSVDETDTIEIKSLFNKNKKDSKGKEKVGNSSDAEEEAEEEIAEQQFDKPANHQRILIYGKAGIGKTTLMKYITYNWAKGKLWNEFDYVFLLPLRKLSNYHKKSAYDGIESFIIEHCLSEGETNLSIKKEIQELRKLFDNNKVLLLLDGYDELNPKEDNKDFIKAIFKSVFSHNKLHIIMTSRPNMVETAYKQEFNCQLVNVGFSDDNVISYIEKNFRGDEETKQNLRRLIEENATVRGMCHTPINLHLLCLVWTELLENYQVKVDNQSFTITSLYQGIVDWLIKRQVSKSGVWKIGKVKNLKHKQIEESHETSLRLMEKVAYEGLQQGKAVLVRGTLSRQGVDAESYEEIQKIGLLKAIETDEGTKSNTQGIIDQEHYFIHLTFQEYMAARCIVRALKSNNDKQVKEAIGFLEDNKYVQRYERMLCFIAGIISLGKEQSKHSSLQILPQSSQALMHFWNVMINGRPDLGIVKQLQLIMNCMDESGIDERIPDIGIIKTYLKDTIISIREAKDKRTVGKIPERIEKWLGIAKPCEELNNKQEINSILIQLQSENEEEELAVLEKIKHIGVENINQIGQKQLVEVLLKLFESSKDKLYIKIKEVLNKIVIQIKDEELNVLVNDSLIRSEVKENELKNQITSWIKTNTARDDIDSLIKEIRNKEHIILNLLLFLTNVDKYISFNSVEILSKLDNIGYEIQAQMFENLLIMLENYDEYIRTRAVKALGRLNINDSQAQFKIITALTSLLTLLNEWDYDARASVIELLGKLNIIDYKVEAKRVEVLTSLLKSQSKYEIINAAKTLGKFNSINLKIQVQIVDSLMTLFESNKTSEFNNILTVLSELSIYDLELERKRTDFFVSLLKNEDNNVVIKVVEVLVESNIINARLKEQLVNTLTPLITDEGIWVHRKIIDTLVKISIIDVTLLKQLVSIARYLLDSKKSSIKVKVLKTLIKLIIADVKILEQFTNTFAFLLKDEDRIVCITAAGALIRFNISDAKIQQQMIDTLLSLIKDKDGSIRSKAAYTLGKLTAIPHHLLMQIITVLVPLLNDKDSIVVTCTERALFNLNTISVKIQQQIVTILTSCLEDEEWSICSKAVDFLGKLNVTDHQLQMQIITALVPLLKDKNINVRSSAEKILVRPAIINPQVQAQMVNYLLPLLQDEDNYVRKIVIEVLGGCNIIDSKVLGEIIVNLIFLLENEDSLVILKAAQALIRLNTIDSKLRAQIAIKLIFLLKNENNYIRKNAAESLIEIEFSNSEVQAQIISSLMTLFKDKDCFVSSQAKKALDKLHFTDYTFQMQITDELFLLLQSNNSNAAEALDKLNITDGRIQAQMADKFLILLTDKDIYIRIKVIQTLNKFDIIDDQIQEKLINTLLLLLQDNDNTICANATSILVKIKIMNLTLQANLLLKLLELLKHAEGRILFNITKVLVGLRITNEIGISFPYLVNELIIIITTIDKHNKISKEIEMIKWRIINILNNLSVSKQTFDNLVEKFLFNNSDSEQMVAHMLPILNTYLEKLLIANVQVFISKDKLKIFSLPLFKQAAIVVKEESVVINYRGYQRVMPYAEGEEDMAYQVFAYSCQMHKQSGIATRLLDYTLNYNKALNITGLKTEYGVLTIPKSTLQQHTYSLVNEAIRVTSKDWLVSIIRKDRSVGNAQHTFLLFEGRNIHYGAELCRAELVQPNPKQNEGRVIVDGYLDIKCSELNRMFQSVLGNNRYNEGSTSAESNPFRANEHYYAKSCLVTREASKAMIGKAKDEATISGGIRYDFQGKKHDNCLTWARKILKAHLSEQEYTGLEIEKNKEAFADPLAYLGPTTAMNVRAAHYVRDGAVKVGKIFNRGK